LELSTYWATAEHVKNKAMQLKTEEDNDELTNIVFPYPVGSLSFVSVMNWQEKISLVLIMLFYQVLNHEI